MQSDPKQIHFVAEQHGSVVTFTPQTKHALRFASSELGLADWQWLSPETFAVDHGVAHDLWVALEEAGWSVRSNPTSTVH